MKNSPLEKIIEKASANSEVKHLSLDPSDWAEFRFQAHRVLDDILSSMEDIRAQPVWKPIPPHIRAQFDEQLPRAGESLTELNKIFKESILPYTARNAHPGFFGWAQGGGTAVGMVAEMLAAGLNANLGGRDQIPIDVENQVTEWMRELFEFPTGSTGLLVTGTSMANLIAVVVARDDRMGTVVRGHGVAGRPEKLTAYASKAVHGCVARALDVAGLGSDCLRLIEVDDHRRMNLTALAQSIESDRILGLEPFLVVATAGTVDTGSIDDLDGIGDLCAREKLWFHVDGAYGALGMLAPDVAVRLKGIHRADSLAFDFHKWAQVPYDAGFILVRDGSKHRAAFSSASAYLARESRGLAAGEVWPCDLGVDLSRGFRALKIWATFKVHGADAIGAVISQTCRLARYLEDRIRHSPELELLAAAELNIVCFRYRFQSTNSVESEALMNRGNRELVIQLQEAGEAAPSITQIDGKVAIRAAIFNHRTCQVDLDTLLESVLEFGRAQMLKLRRASIPKTESRPWISRNERMRSLDLRFSSGKGMTKELEVPLRVERATLLLEAGRSLEARNEFLKVLEMDPSNLSCLLGVGKLCVAAGQRKAAQMVYEEALKHHPHDLVCHVNLGSVLLESDQLAEARKHYEFVLAIAPDFPQAHGGMYYLLTRLGDLTAAARHQQQAFGQNNVFRLPYCGNSKPIPIVLLVSSTGGNTPIEQLIEDRTFVTHLVVADFYNSKTPLPPCELIVNGIGDPDMSADALGKAEMLIAKSSSPVLNKPVAVRASGRSLMAERMRGIPGLKVPRMAVMRLAELARPEGHELLAARGFSFPMLLRIPGFHMGQHFDRVDSSEQLIPAVTKLSGLQIAGAEVLAIEYLEANGADGCARKFRVMTIGGRLYPLHLAISKSWKVHYFSADMADSRPHRLEEAEFLADMPAAIGSKAMMALEELSKLLDLDYGGIDFGLNQNGDVLLFEANATMVVERPNSDRRWNYRREPIERALSAVHDLLKKMARPSLDVLASSLPR